LQETKAGQSKLYSSCTWSKICKSSSLFNNHNEVAGAYLIVFYYQFICFCLSLFFLALTNSRVCFVALFESNLIYFVWKGYKVDVIKLSQVVRCKEAEQNKRTAFLMLLNSFWLILKCQLNLFSFTSFCCFSVHAWLTLDLNQLLIT